MFSQRSILLRVVESEVGSNKRTCFLHGQGQIKAIIDRSLCRARNRQTSQGKGSGGKDLKRQFQEAAQCRASLIWIELVEYHSLPNGIRNLSIKEIWNHQ